MSLGKKGLGRILAGAGLIILVMGGLEAEYWGRVIPGVKVAGINIGGMDTNQAAAAITRKTNQMKQIELVWGTNKWTISLADMGAAYDAGETVAEAMKIGRSGGWRRILSERYAATQNGINIDPIFVIGENNLIGSVASIAAQINVPAKEPEVSYDKAGGQVSVSPGENGQEVDTRLLVELIKAKLAHFDETAITVPVVAMEPKLNEAQLEQAKERAQKLVGKQLTISFADGEQKWVVDDEQLMTWIDPSTSSGWKQDEMAGWVAQLAAGVDRVPGNASFLFVGPGKVQEFRPAKEGWQVNQDQVNQDVLAAAEKLSGTDKTAVVELTVNKTDPTVKNSQVNNLGIKELLGRGESWFSGSIDNRIFNIQKATEALNGMLVAPGETFSFNQAIGEVSANTGYKQAYVISEGKTVLGDGGGVCQTSTTLFRAVLAAGLPIEERVAHAYRVSYYEQNYQPGFDATVFQPSPDFKFKNDTSAYILIQTKFDATAGKLTYDIYGTSDGRKVETSKSRVWDITPPPPDLYQDDPTLPVGKIVQTEHAAWGAKVAFDWKVTRGNEVLQQRTFYSNYVPWQAVYLRGTKT